MANTPFKLKGFSGFGNSPMKHWKLSASHMASHVKKGFKDLKEGSRKSKVIKEIKENPDKKDEIIKREKNR